MKLRVVAAKLTAEHHDFLLLLLLFAAMRFMALIFEGQGGWLQHTPALDYWFYLRFAELSQRDLYPFVHYWLEYQPVFAWLVIGVYKLSLHIPPFGVHLFSFYLLLGSLCTLADVGNLALIYLIGRRVHGAVVGFRAALIYALLFLPLYVTQGWYDSIPVFLLLLALYLLLVDHPRWSALVCGIGFMTKLLPVLVLLVAVRTLVGWRERLLYVAVWGVVVVAIAAPFLVVNPAMLVASFKAAVVRSSWETIWALLENYYGYGVVVDLAERFTPETASWQSHPSTLPWLWITAAFAVVGGLVYLRRLDLGEPARVLALSSFTVMLFFLYAKGYSPQFAVYILPFIVLLLPSLWGIVLVLLYSVANLLEFPIYMSALMDRAWILWLAVAARTAILLVVTLEATSLLYPRVRRHVQRAKASLVKPAAVGILLLIVVAGVALYRDYSQAGPYFTVGRFVEPLSTSRQAIVAMSTSAFASLHPRLPGYSYYVLPEDWGTRADQIAQELQQLGEVHSQLWIVFDGRRREDAAFAFVQRQLQGFGVRAADEWFESLRLVNIVTPAGATEIAPHRSSVNALFGGQLAAQNIGLSEDSVPAGTALRLAIQWTVVQPIERDLSVFVHMLLPDSRVWSQADKLLDRNGEPTSRWSVGDVVEDVVTVRIPDGTPPLEYRLIAGVYDMKTGERLTFAGSPGGFNWLEAGQVRVRRAPLTTGVKIDLAQLPDFREGLRVRGVEAPREVEPGEVFALNVLWQSTRDHMPDLLAAYRLVDDQGRVVAQASDVPGDQAYPTSRWTSGEVVRDQRALHVASEARPGDYKLLADIRLLGDQTSSVSGAGQVPGGLPQPVATIKVKPRTSAVAP